MRKAGSGRGDPPPQEKAHQLVVQYQMVSNTTGIEEVIFGNTYVYTNTYMCVKTTDGKKGHKLEEQEGECEGAKGKGEML